jgi:hypothetical protein
MAALTANEKRTSVGSLGEIADFFPILQSTRNPILDYPYNCQRRIVGLVFLREIIDRMEN